jgi:type VI secretion system protein ImpA
VTAWLIEALTRLHGFGGLRDGFRLARQLSERYWEQIHPRPDEDGIATTVSQLTGLNGDESDGTLLAPMLAIPITMGNSCGPFSSANYLDANELEHKSNPEIRAQRIERGAVTLAMFEKAVDETPPEFFQNLLEDVAQAGEQYQSLSDVLQQQCGQTAGGYSLAPPSSNIRNALLECHERVRQISRHRLPSGVEDGQVPAGELVLVGGQSPGSALNANVHTREEAFRALLQVAEFFRRTEPHSPVSYALEQAVRWGRMPLPELMTELISDDAVRHDLFRRTGIAPRRPEGSD